MITPNPMLGTLLHAMGGISASSCYLPSTRTRNWSWGSFWIVQAGFAWFIVPALLGITTIPDFFHILRNSPQDAVTGAFLLGALYGFGGMSFGLSIKHIGYSLTYTISIGISAVLGTIIPLVFSTKGFETHRLIEYFTKPGSNIVILGMVISIIGVALCGLAGFLKERDIKSNAQPGETSAQFNMKMGLSLAILAGVLSGIFNLSLEFGQPIADLAAANGAGHFEGNAKLIVSTSGCLLVNLIWFITLGIKQKTLTEFTSKSGIPLKIRLQNTFWSMLAGTLWTGQFFFYGLGHVKMGSFQFVSWALHMSMLIFFSYVVGLIMKEWKNVRKSTYRLLLVALAALFASFIISSAGSYYGEKIASQAESEAGRVEPITD
jgi:L-rhamnose-H+ transport protein